MGNRGDTSPKGCSKMPEGSPSVHQAASGISHAQPPRKTPGACAAGAASCMRCLVLHGKLQRSTASFHRCAMRKLWPPSPPPLRPISAARIGPATPPPRFRPARRRNIERSHVEKHNPELPRVRIKKYSPFTRCSRILNKELRVHGGGGGGSFFLPMQLTVLLRPRECIDVRAHWLSCFLPALCCAACVLAVDVFGRGRAGAYAAHAGRGRSGWLLAAGFWLAGWLAQTHTCLY